MPFQDINIAKKRMIELQTHWCQFDINESPLYIEQEKNVLIDQLKEESRNCFIDVPVGILHSHELKGPEVWACECSNDSIRFVVVDYRFTNFLYACNEIIFQQLLSEYNGDHSQETYKSNAEALISQFSRFNNTIGIPRLPNSILSSMGQTKSPVPSIWLEAQRLFIVGHELSHFLLGHLGSDRLSPLKREGIEYVLPSGTKFNFITRKQVEELHADFQSTAMTINCILAIDNMDKVAKDMHFVGIDILFQLFLMIDIFTGRANNSQVEYTDDNNLPTHPDGASRLTSWREHFEARIVTETSGQAHAASKVTHRIIQSFLSGEFGSLSDISKRSKESTGSFIENLLKNTKKKGEQNDT